MGLSKINPILAIALASVLATSILSTQLSSLNSLVHTGHENNVSNLHAAEAISLPLPIDFHYKIKEKAGDAAEGTKYVEIDENFVDSENNCEFCVYIKVEPGPKGQTGLVYVSEQGLDLSSAKSVTFFAMGLDGGEKLKFGVAGKTVSDKVKNGDINASSLFKDKKFALTTEEVTLENDWLPFSVDLTDVPKEQLTGVTHPFSIEMSKIKGEQEFYIKHIIYKTEEAELNTLTTTAEAANATLVANVTDVANATDISADNATDANATDVTDNATETANNMTELEEPTQSNASETSTNDTDDVEDVENATATDPENTEEDIGDNATQPSSASVEENMPPIAKANDDIIAYAGDEVLLDGLASYDEDDGDTLAYEWTQSDGPDLEITDEDTAIPVVKIPSDIDEDERAMIDLIVSDGKAESEKDSVTIFIDYVEPLDDLDQQIQTQELEPDDVEDSEWKMTKCKNLVDCLTDEKENTFTGTGSEGEDDIGKADILSFENLEVEENEDAEIKQVIIQADAARSGDTGYIRFIVDDAETYESNLMSITSDYISEYRLVLDRDPITGDEWTVDSVNSIVAGYAYGGGEEVKVAAMKLTVIYTIVPSEQATEEEETGEDQGLTEEESDSQPTIESDSQEQSLENEESAEGADGDSATVQGNSTGGDGEQVNSEEETE